MPPDVVVDPRAQLLDKLAARIEQGQGVAPALRAALTEVGIDPREALLALSTGATLPSEILARYLSPAVLRHLISHEQQGEMAGGLRYAAAAQRAIARTTVTLSREAFGGQPDRESVEVDLREPVRGSS